MSNDYLKEYLLDAQKNLIGKKIVGIRRVKKNDLDAEGLNEEFEDCLQIIFNDGHWLVSSIDPEGNGKGVFFTTYRDCECLI
jgi:hypothetical protein